MIIGRLFDTVIVLLFAATVSAQPPPSGVFGAPGIAAQPPRDRPAPGAGTAGIRGRVTAVDGLPLVRATVRLNSPTLPEGQAVLTDATGRYEFHDLAAGRYNLSAIKTGFVAASYGQTRVGELPKPIDVPDGQTIERIDLRLARAGVISGRVVDDFGEPVVSASVQALLVRTVNGERQPTPMNMPFSTPDTGEFRLWDLAPGEYYVLVNTRMMGRLRESADSGLGFIPMYFPGTANLAEAQLIRLGRGETASGIEVTLTPARTARITGSVIDTRGQPLRGGNVNAFSRTSAPVMGGMSTSGVIRPDGTFTIAGLAPGEYELRAANRPAQPGTPSETMSAIVTIVRDDVSGVLLTPIVPVRVAGRITLDPPSTALEPSMVRINAFPSGRQGPTFGGISGPPIVHDDFTFELFSSPGSIRLGVFTPSLPGWSLKSVRVRSEDVTNQPIVLAAGGDLDDVEIVLTNRVQTVTGMITNSRAETLQDARVIAFPQDRSLWDGPSPPMTVGTARPDQNGRYQLRSLRAGDYFILALPFANDAPSGRGTEYYEQLSRDATRFTLKDSETKAIDLKLVEPR